MEKIPWRREWLPTAVFLPGESHGQRSLAGYSPWGRKESDSSFNYEDGFKSRHHLLNPGVQIHLQGSEEPPGQHPMPFIYEFLLPASWWDRMTEWITGISPHSHKSPPWLRSSLPTLFNSTRSSPPLSPGKESPHEGTSRFWKPLWAQKKKHLSFSSHNIYPPVGVNLL